MFTTPSVFRYVCFRTFFKYFANLSSMIIFNVSLTRELPISIALELSSQPFRN